MFIMATLAMSTNCYCYALDETTGIWQGKDIGCAHMFDPSLAQGISQFFIEEKAESVVDLGCGMGIYTMMLKSYGLNCDGFDGNPDTPIVTGGVCQVQPLHVSFDLDKQYSWVMCLEVGELVPAEFEDTFIENLVNHAKDGILLSWAVVGQSGWGHVNCQNNDYIRACIESYDFESDFEAEESLRAQATTCGHFKDTIMVFRKVK